MTRERAIDIALAAVPGWTTADVNAVQSGIFGELGSASGRVLVPERPTADTPVWRVDLAKGAGPSGSSIITLIIGADGTIIQRTDISS
jgi:hypothetical protein